jgi:uncharacterized protein (DUF58 family)
MLAGEFASVFKGEGLDFDGVRHYEPGDDVRSIDWNVSARFGRPYVKMYREERELTVFLVLDCSASMRSPGQGLSRFDQGVLSLALLAFSAERGGQRLGALFFDSGISRIFPPRRGRKHIMAVIGAALDYGSGDGAALRGAPLRGSALGTALSLSARMLKRPSLVVLISDFYCVDWEAELRKLAARHDCVTIRLTDPLDGDLPSGGLISFSDAETGGSFPAPASHGGFRGAWNTWHEDRARLWQSICERAGASLLELSTAADALPVLRRFFKARLRAPARLRGRA